MCRSEVTAPSASRSRTCMPGSPVTGSESTPSRALRGLSRTSTPSTTVTSTPRAVKPSATDRWCGARTTADPPPMFTVSTACRPMRATRASPASGSASSLLRTVMPRAARSSSCARRSSLSGAGTPGHDRPSPVAPTRSASSSRRPSFSSSTDSSTSPDSTAATSASPQGPTGPGMTRSSPPLAAGPALFAANQSDMTRPSHDQSSRRTSIWTWRCSVAGRPLTSLYADITDHGLLSSIAISKGRR